jgi:hypothetical protein
MGPARQPVARTARPSTACDLGCSSAGGTHGSSSYRPSLVTTCSSVGGARTSGWIIFNNPPISRDHRHTANKVRSCRRDWVFEIRVPLAIKHGPRPLLLIPSKTEAPSPARVEEPRKREREDGSRRGYSSRSRDWLPWCGRGTLMGSGMTYDAFRGGWDAWDIGNFTPDLGFRRKNHFTPWPVRQGARTTSWVPLPRSPCHSRRVAPSTLRFGLLCGDPVSCGHGTTATASASPPGLGVGRTTHDRR